MTQIHFEYRREGNEVEVIKIETQEEEKSYFYHTNTRKRNTQIFKRILNVKYFAQKKEKKINLFSFSVI